MPTTWAKVIGQKHVQDKVGILENTCFVFMDIGNLIVSDIKVSFLSVDSGVWWTLILHKYLVKT